MLELDENCETSNRLNLSQRGCALMDRRHFFQLLFGAPGLALLREPEELPEELPIEPHSVQRAAAQPTKPEPFTWYSVSWDDGTDRGRYQTCGHRHETIQDAEKCRRQAPCCGSYTFANDSEHPPDVSVYYYSRALNLKEEAIFQAVAYSLGPESCR